MPAVLVHEAMTIELADGPRIWLPEVGWLPGPPFRLTRPGSPPTVLLVDPHPMDPFDQGGVHVEVISPAEGLAIVRRILGSADQPEEDRWLTVCDAARVLGVSRRTIDRAIEAQGPDARPSRLPSRGDGERVRWGWPDERALRAWWATTVTRPADAPRPRPPKPRPPKLADPAPVDWGEVGRRFRKGR